jgi:hypothetical protein
MEIEILFGIFEIESALKVDNPDDSQNDGSQQQDG